LYGEGMREREREGGREGGKEEEEAEMWHLSCYFWVQWGR